MRIACLGWGSLIWQPDGLNISGKWRQDGPPARVEFARQSSDGRMTLVLEKSAQAVPALWAWMADSDLGKAIESLRKREKTSRSFIGAWLAKAAAPEFFPELPAWAQRNGIDAVIWTALRPKFGGEHITPTAEQVIEYLRSLLGEQRIKAERYIRQAPRQIATVYRRRIEAELGWK